jgi:DNA-directed RNA polymerase specialized sigma24 family protein
MTRDDSRSSPDPANADDLLRHAAWLRALARTLVGEADADDVVQETWVAAVAHRPSAVHSLRAWLGAVARNVVRQRARRARRRGA